MNKKCVALTEDQYKTIITTIRSGFTLQDGRHVKPNERIATILVLEANLGLRISDILRLHLNDIIRDGDRYRLDIIEQKTGKRREFTVPIEIYSFMQAYALDHGISSAAKLFDIRERVVQRHLQLVSEFLGYERISTHSFRKFFAASIYFDSGFNVELVRELLQHGSVTTTQRYISIGRKDLETALHNHVRIA